MSFLNPFSWFRRKSDRDGFETGRFFNKKSRSRKKVDFADSMSSGSKASWLRRLKRRLVGRKDAEALKSFGQAAPDVRVNRRLKVRRWLLALPSLVMVLTLCGILIHGIRSRSDISNRYRDAARSAVGENDIKLARF